MRPLRATTLSVAEAPAASAAHPPGWHSPVPYLFGGLAAMLGLIAFSLLILACSYWKLSGYPSDEAHDVPESGGGDQPPKEAAGWESNVLVIMAGQAIPTFLATPSTSRSSSFGDTTASNSSSGGSTVVHNCEGDKTHKVAVELSESVAAVAGAKGEDHQHYQSVADVAV